MVFFIFMCVIAIVLIMFAAIQSAKNEEQEDLRKQKQEERDECNRLYEADKARERSVNEKLLTNKYGAITKQISINDFDINKQIIAFQETKIMYILGETYSFSDLLSCSLSNNQTTVKGAITHETTTNSGNMAKRAAVGGLLLGGAGAVIGGGTASKQTVTNQQADKIYNDYTVIINTKDISNPIMRIHVGDDGRKANDIIALINAVIANK